MKNIMLIILLAFAACKKRDNGPTVKEENRPFIGTWIGTNDTLLSPDTIVFLENQLFTSKIYNTIDSFGIESDSIKFFFKSNIASSYAKYRYSIDGDNLLIYCWGLAVRSACYNYKFKKL